jgi:predicted ATPase
VVATHSPILLAYPGARLYSFDASPPEAVPYEEVDHVRLTREFLAEPGRFLRHI